jgi:hypothetical protein
MAEPTQYIFSLKEAATALIKQQNITEGHWLVGFGMQMSVGMMGPTPQEARPSTLVQINHIQLVRAENPESDVHSVNAAEVNPQPRSTRKK